MMIWHEGLMKAIIWIHLIIWNEWVRDIPLRLILLGVRERWWKSMVQKAWQLRLLSWNWSSETKLRLRHFLLWLSIVACFGTIKRTQAISSNTSYLMRDLKLFIIPLLATFSIVFWSSLINNLELTIFILGASWLAIDWWPRLALSWL